MRLIDVTLDQLREMVREVVRDAVREELDRRARERPPRGPIDQAAAGKLSGATTVRPSDAARMLGYGKTKIFELLRSGELSSFLVGRTRMIEVAEIKRWIERHQER